MANNTFRSKISSLPVKLVADPTDTVVAWSNVSNLDVRLPVENLFQTSNVSTLNLVVNGEITIGNSTVNLTINSTYAPGTVGGANLNPSTDALYTVGNSSLRWGPIYSNNITLGDNSSIVFVNSSSISLGNSSVNAILNSTSYSGVILTANNADFVGGLPANTFANAVTPNFVGSINVGANVSLSNTTLFIGNSTISSTVNSTIFSGIAWNANNANYLAGQSPAFYANVTAPVFSTSVNVGTVSVNTSAIQLNTGSINATNFTGTSNNANNLAGLPPSYFANVTNPSFSLSINIGQIGINTTAIDIGNSTVNSIVNSTVFTGTANNSNNFAGQSLGYFANVTNPTLSQSLAVGANLQVNTSTIFIGNSTVSTTVNSTAFTGTANNANNFGGQPPSAFANVTNPDFTTSINVSANVQLNTTSLSIGNSTVNSVLNSTAIFVGGQFFSNQTATFLPGQVQANGSLGSVGQVLASGGISSNAYWANQSGGGGSANGANQSLQFNNSGSFAGDANLSWNPTLAVLSIGNSTVNATINSTVFSGQSLTANLAVTANNANNFGGQQPSFYANVTAPVFSTSVNVGANVSINTSVISVGNSTVNVHINTTSFSGTANNATNLGLIPASSYQLTIGLASNVATLTSNNSTNFAGQPQSFYANATAPIFGVSVNVGANVSLNTSTITLGNTTVNTQINSSAIVTESLLVGNTSINSGTVFLGGSVEANGSFGVSGQVLTTSGTGANAYWSTVSSGNSGGTPGGANTELQFNDSGAFGGDANLNWYKTIGSLVIGNSTVNSVINSTALTIATINVSGNVTLGGNVLSGPGTFTQHGNFVPSTNATYGLGLPGATWEGYFSFISAGNSIANAVLSQTTLVIGNSTVNSTINATNFTGQSNDSLNLNGIPAVAYQLNSLLASNVATMTANNANNLGGNPPAYFANVTNPDFTTSVNVGSNVYINTSVLSIGNSSVNTVINSSTISTTTTGAAQFALVGPTSNIVINSTVIFIGNSTVNTTINSTSTGGGGGGDATTLQGHPASYFANVTSPNFSSFLTVGNSTVNTSVNATTFSGTSNNATNLGGVAASGYQLNSTLAANVAVLNSNNANNFSGQPQSYYANASAPNFSVSANVGANLQINTSSIFIGNSTVNSTVNSTTFTGTANNSTNFGGQAPTFYANITTPVISTSVSVGANVIANLTAFSVVNGALTTIMNATKFSTGNATSFIQATQAALAIANSASETVINPISLTIFDGVQTAFVNTTVMSIGNATVNATINSTIVTIGNSTVNATINSTAFSGTVNNATNLGGVAAASYQTVAGLASNVAGLTANNATNLGGVAASGYANVTSPVFTTTVNVGANVSHNTSALSIGNSTVNSVMNSTTFTGTANNATNLGGVAASGYANTTAAVFSTTAAVGANLVANTSALLIGNSTVNVHVNSTAIFIGNSTVSFTINSTPSFANANNSTNFAGQPQSYYANVTTPVFSTTVNVGANVSINTSALFIGNSTVNNIINSTGMSITTLTISGNTVLGGNVFAGPGQITQQGDIIPYFDNSYSIGQFGNTWIGYFADITIGNSTVSAFINSVYFDIPNIVNANGSNGSAGQVLVSGGTGNVYWAAASSGNGSVGGSNTYIQFNNSGAFGGDANLEWISTNATLKTVNLSVTGVATLGSIFIGNSTVNTNINSTVIDVNQVLANSGLGTAGWALLSGGASGNVYWAAVSGGSGTPGGANTQLQFNNSGAFGGDANLEWISTNATLKVVNLSISTAASVGANVVVNTSVISIGNSTVNSFLNSTAIDVNQVVANASLGTAGYVLASGGASANAYWTPAGGGGGTPGGSNTQIQFDNSGVFGGDANLTWVSPSTLLTIGNSSANVEINSISLRMGNSTVNSVINSSTFVVNTNAVAQLSVSGAAGLTTINSSGIFTGNSTVNASINSSTFTANTNTIAFLKVTGASSNLLINSTTLSIGNSTVNSILNSTALVVNAVDINYISANAANVGTAGYVLTSGGPSANAYWAAAGGGGGTPGGSNTYIQFNNSGAFGGDANLEWITTSATLKIGNSTVNSSINSTVFSGTSNNATNLGGVAASGYQTTAGLAGNVTTLTANNTLFVGTVSAANVVSNAQLVSNLAGYANLTAPVFSITANVGSNVSINTSALFIGNSTVNSSVNSTIFSGTANNSTNLGGVAASGYQTTAGLAGNVTTLTANNTLFVGTVSAVNVVSNAQLISNLAGYANLSAPVFTTTLEVGAASNNVTINTTTITIGNSTVNVSINSSTAFGGGGGGPFGSTTQIAFNKAGTESGDANLVWGYTTATLGISNAISIGNSTVNNIINSTSYSGIANDTLFVGTVSAANVVSNTQLASNLANYTNTAGLSVYQTTAGLSGNVATLTANDTLFVGTVTAVNVVSNAQLISNLAGYANITTPLISTSVTVGNSTVNATINSTAFTGTSNNSTNFAGQTQSYYANVTAPVFSTTAAVGANVIANTSAITIGNSTVNASINSTVFSGTANNATNLGGVAASGYQTTAGMLSNVVTLTANDTLFVGTVSAANVVSNAQLISNLAGYANITTPVISTTINVGSNVSINTSTLSIGNSTVNVQINSSLLVGTSNNSLNFSGQPQSYYANITSPVFSTSVTVGANISISATKITLGNTTVNTQINSTSISTDQISVNGSFGTATYVLTSAGAAANAYWAPAGGGGGPFGSNTQIAFNNSGTESGDANLVWYTTNGTLSVANGIVIGNSTVKVSINSTTTFGGGGSTSNLTTIVSSATVNVGYFYLVTNAGITLTLPTTSLSNGNQIIIKDMTGNSTPNITISGNVDSNTTGAVINMQEAYMRLTYYSPLTAWIATG